MLLSDLTNQMTFQEDLKIDLINFQTDDPQSQANINISLIKIYFYSTLETSGQVYQDQEDNPD